MGLMSTLSEKTTLYLNPYVKKFIQHKAVNEGRSISDVVNEEFAELLQDLEDSYELSKRKEDPIFKPWTEVKKQLKADGLL
jgi:hypothetical protein